MRTSVRPRAGIPPLRQLATAFAARISPALAFVAALLLAAFAPAVRAQVPASGDSGMFVIFEQAVPVANEHFQYQFMGDSLMITSTTRRQFQDDKGQRLSFVKRMVLVVDAHDLGLMRYTSNQEFHDRKLVNGLLPGDTVMTHFSEREGVGSADRLVQPPGRLFVLDPQLFTLFDVLCRSLAGKEFVSRRVQLVALAPDSLSMPLATITVGKPETYLLGSVRVPARRYAFEDQGVRFDLWADAQGRMLRLANEPSGLSVERAPDAKPASATKKRVPARR
jgi:hypothetical protein